MKYFLIIGDGMSDNAIESLGGKTPLEYADKKTIDELCKKGECGEVLTVPRGVAANSDTAILSIMSYDPRKFYSGRSPLEAAGCGVTLVDGDTSYRCNMVALTEEESVYEEKTILSHSGGSVDGKESVELITWLCKQESFKKLLQKYEMTIHPNPSFRHMCVQKNAKIEGLSATPPHNILGQKIGAYMPKNCEGAEGLYEMMKEANRLLEGHPVNESRKARGLLPANGIWFWAEGTAIQFKSFYDKYNKRGAVISAVPLVHGIGVLTGMDMITVEGATGELETNYEGKARAALEAIKKYDFVTVHLEAPDECTHNGDLEGKLLSIHRLSEDIVRPIVEGMTEDFRMLIISDHKTLMSTRTHDGEPVPYLYYDSTRDTKLNLPYDEVSATKGEYIGEGHTLMARLFGIKE